MTLFNHFVKEIMYMCGLVKQFNEVYNTFEIVFCKNKTKSILTLRWTSFEIRL